MTARQRFVELALEQLGRPVLWCQKGPDAFDCSGLMTHCLRLAGGPDLRAAWNSQRLADETPDLATGRPVVIEPLPGDLLFYGLASNRIEHVAIVLAGGKALSADGATSHQLDLQVAKADPHCRVRLHDRFDFRGDLPFRAVHRNSFLDALDKICL